MANRLGITSDQDNCQALVAGFICDLPGPLRVEAPRAGGTLRRAQEITPPGQVTGLAEQHSAVVFG